MPKIRTYTGRNVDPFNLKPQDIHPADLAHALAFTPRWGGHATKVYSVGQHSLHVSALLGHLGPEMELYGLLHDAAEAYLGDVRSPLKNRLVVSGPLGLEDFHIIEARAQGVIFSLLELDPEIPGQVHRADLLARATEARDLFSPPLSLPGLPNPLVESIIVAEPEVIKTAWLERLVVLLGELDVGFKMQSQALAKLLCRLPANPDRTPVLAVVAG